MTFTQKTAAQLYAYMFIPGNTGVTGDIEETVKEFPPAES